MPAITIIFAAAIVVEIAAFLHCVESRIPFGRGFGLSMLAQVALPILLFAGFGVWNHMDPPTLGLDPLGGEAYARSWDFIASAFWVVFLTTIMAGLCGGIRMASRRVGG